jgi:hypothetical protein
MGYELSNEDLQNLVSADRVVSEQINKQEDPLTKWQLDNLKTIERLKHYLRGEVPKWDEKLKAVIWTPEGYRMMNDKGVRMTLSLVSSMSDKDTVLTTLDKNEIASTMRALHKHVAQLFGEKYKEYEIDKGDLTVIIDIVTNKIWFAMKRAEGGAEKNFIAKLGVARKEVSTIVPAEIQQAQQRGFLGLPKLLKG